MNQPSPSSAEDKELADRKNAAVALRMRILDAFLKIMPDGEVQEEIAKYIPNAALKSPNPPPPIGDEEDKKNAAIELRAAIFQAFKDCTKEWLRTDLQSRLPRLAPSPYSPPIQKLIDADFKRKEEPKIGEPGYNERRDIRDVTTLDELRARLHRALKGTALQADSERCRYMGSYNNFIKAGTSPRDNLSADDFASHKAKLMQQMCAVADAYLNHEQQLMIEQSAIKNPHTFMHKGTTEYTGMKDLESAILAPLVEAYDAMNAISPWHPKNPMPGGMTDHRYALGEALEFIQNSVTAARESIYDNAGGKAKLRPVEKAAAEDNSAAKGNGASSHPGNTVNGAKTNHGKANGTDSTPATEKLSDDRLYYLRKQLAEEAAAKAAELAKQQEGQGMFARIGSKLGIGRGRG